MWPEQNTMPYRVMVDDNAHYRDESERYEFGTFATPDEAIAVCKRMVDDDLNSHLKAGITADELYSIYTTFDRDPFVVATNGEPAIQFSAWSYAREQCEILARVQRK
jgi:hypothetical protein